MDLARRLYAEGRLAEAEARCRAILHDSPRHPPALHLLGLIRFAGHDLDQAAFLLTAALGAAPETPEILSDLGCVMLSDGRPREALQVLDRAVAGDPGRAAAWTLKGHAHEALQQGQQAEEAYRRSLALNPRQAGLWITLASLLLPFDPGEGLTCIDMALSLEPRSADAFLARGNLLLAAGRAPDAVGAFTDALAADPARTDVMLNLAGALMRMNRPRAAIAWYEKCGPDAEARFGRALALLVMGDLEDGFAGYEARLEIPGLAVPYTPPLPRWTGPDDANRAVLVYEEQGIGDTIQCLRYVPLLRERGLHVVVSVRPALLELAATMEGADRVVPTGEAAKECTGAIPVMSLPLALGTTLATVPATCPYLTPPRSRVESWRNRLPDDGGRLRVGIAWSGNPSFRNDRNRSMRLARLDPLLRRDDCAFHVLQTGLGTVDRLTMTEFADLRNTAASFVDLSDTAAVASMMDVVISVDTALAHLAGALAVPVWIMLPFAPDWRWLLETESSVWYPTARLFRQAEPGDWDGVIARIDDALSLAARTARRSGTERPVPAG